MPYDLIPRNRQQGEMTIGAFAWPWMLEAGLGLPLTHGKGIEPGSFVYADRPDGRCVAYNDGARVSAGEAKEMAKLARWIADYQDTLHTIFDRQPDDVKERQLKNEHRLYHIPVRRDWVAKLREFADWAEKSGGFRVD